MNHELHDTLASSIMLLSQVLASIQDESLKRFVNVVHSQLHVTLSFLNDINDYKMLNIGKFFRKVQEYEPLSPF